MSGYNDWLKPLNASGAPMSLDERMEMIRAARSMGDLTAFVTRISLPYDITLELRSAEKWAVVLGQRACINTDMEAEVEPMPSGRDEAFLSRTRFSFEQAIEIYLQYLNTNEWAKS